MSDIDDLDLSGWLPPVSEPPDGLADLHRRLRRHRRRKTAAIATAAVLAAGAATTALVATSAQHPRRNSVVVTPGPTLPAVCAGGGTPQPGLARVGMSVKPGYLPPGYQAVSGIASTYTPDGQALSRDDRITVSVLAFDSADDGGSAPPDQSAQTIEGHPATVTTSPAGSEPNSVQIDFSPQPDIHISVHGIGVAETTMKEVAEHVIYTPGVTAPAVGDLGPVIPRTTVISANQPGPSPSASTRTWLTTYGQFIAADPQGEASLAGQPALPSGQPIWVVAYIGTFTSTGTATPMHEVIDAVDAVTGSVFYTEQDPRSGTETWINSLIDHSSYPPCPDPPPTSP
jgi:hypothetical protein